MYELPNFETQLTWIKSAGGESSSPPPSEALAMTRSGPETTAAPFSSAVPTDEVPPPAFRCAAGMEMERPSRSGWSGSATFTLTSTPPPPVSSFPCRRARTQPQPAAVLGPGLDEAVEEDEAVRLVKSDARSDSSPLLFFESGSFVLLFPFAGLELDANAERRRERRTHTAVPPPPPPPAAAGADSILFTGMLRCVPLCQLSRLWLRSLGYTARINLTA